MKTKQFNRRSFLQHSLTMAAGVPLGTMLGGRLASATESVVARASSGAAIRSGAKVAIVSCRTYGAEVRSSLEKAFDLLGGIGSLVKDKTVAVKLNLTGTDFTPFLDRPVGETYMTHYATAAALA